MKILLTNDDGYFAPGIKEMGLALINEGHDVTIVAPDNQNSGKSHSVTFMESIEFHIVEIEGIEIPCYSVSGTPADCVRAAIHVLGRDFDYCFSGINLGYNAGLDVLYSGTVSAAIEANIFGINSIAVSSEYKEDGPIYETAAKVAVEIFNKIQGKLDKTQVLNINVPSLPRDEVKGIEVCRIGDSVIDKYRTYKTSGGYELKMYAREYPEYREATDRFYLENGYATVTPLIYDLTNEKLMKDLEKYLWKI